MRWRLILMVIVTLGILHIPVIGMYFRALNTMIHESGHALASLLTQGKVASISLFYSTEGVTMTWSHSQIGLIATAIAGYMFSSLSGWGLAALWRRGHISAILAVLFVLAAINLVFWVRNAYGIVWLSVFLILLVVIMRWHASAGRESAALILILFINMDAVRSALTIAELSWFTPGSAGDATSLSTHIGLPTVVWGVFFLLQSLILAFLALQQLWNTKPRREVPQQPSTAAYSTYRS